MDYSGNKQGYGYPAPHSPPGYGVQPYPHAPVVAPAYAVQTTYVAQPTVVVPVYRPFWNNLALTSITSGLRNFLLISGLFYLVWGILAVGLEIGIIIHSYTTYYRGFWMGAFVIGAGISMLYAACQGSYILLHLVRSLSLSLFFCILGAIFSIVNYSLSTQCSSYIYYYSCDGVLATNLKIAILALSIVATIHTIINMVVISNRHKQSVMAAAAGNPH